MIRLRVRETQRLQPHNMRLLPTPTDNICLDMHVSRCGHCGAHSSVRRAPRSRCVREGLHLVFGYLAGGPLCGLGIGDNLQVRCKVPVLVERMVWLGGYDIHGDVVRYAVRKDWYEWGQVEVECWKVQGTVCRDRPTIRREHNQQVSSIRDEPPQGWSNTAGEDNNISVPLSSMMHDM